MFQSEENPNEYGVYLSADIARLRGVRPWDPARQDDKLEKLIRRLQALIDEIADERKRRRR